jgi:hypothetical protein
MSRRSFGSTIRIASCAQQGLWFLYLSIVNVGQRFYSFGWESLLLEAGFLAIFLGNASTAPPFVILLLFRWLVFRVELGAGLIKLRGDPCWRELTCMDFHHETQPMPGPLSWYFHRLPRTLHRIEVLGNYAAQLVAPFMLFLPQPVAGIGALLMIGTQSYLVMSGNYAWLNALTLVIAFAGLPDAWLSHLWPGTVSAQEFAVAPYWYLVLVLLVGGLVIVLSYWPVRNTGCSRWSIACFRTIRPRFGFSSGTHLPRRRRPGFELGCITIDSRRGRSDRRRAPGGSANWSLTTSLP